MRNTTKIQPDADESVLPVIIYGLVWLQVALVVVALIMAIAGLSVVAWRGSESIARDGVEMPATRAVLVSP